MWQLRIGKVLLCICAALAVAAVAVGTALYNEGSAAQARASQLLAGYEQAAGQAQIKESQQAVPSGDGAVSSSRLAQVSVNGFIVLGTLEIGRIGEKLPVISYTDDETLKVSVSYFTGSLPGEKGNMVITGHNYADGAMFGKLKQMKIGDIVTFATPVRTYTYEVYDIKTVAPDNTAALDQYQGDYALTLLTCSDQGNKRLLVMGRLTNGSV